MYPCVRESGLTAIGVGFGVGGMRALFGGMSEIYIPRCNSAISTS